MSEYVVRYNKNGTWKTVDGSYYSKLSAMEKVKELEEKGYQVQIIKK